ncbi:MULTISPECIES: SDR family NAD(P)-dependent oxidoreductase [Hyphomicrobiales]|uniref:SDR family NAD(P)-dependent oxidoreductase n=1 Tax=Prosthecodimorpha staleyi TaxID=2840188 RepID=A0A947D0J4_9HYPH|nr:MULTISPECIES: SDR family NAD(P)-dependent oxidoreductase [Hyphomicrobiales]MBT9288705.1 SDR family NAD(P)-dependent oxidoreductase [Prosthecodimorpha staleyi]MCW1843523.1 SDR family NAD(P)-dependent oxidoreductase [Prosthecomicrobium hirschii]TPQ52887.1 NADP-dependent 3-hydroxy acid dehydrogenase [Prosthecomicrobium hirschii]
MTKTVLITGASAGFGAATARRFVAGGWRVIITARRAERLADLAAELGGPEVAHVAAFDMRDEAAMDAALAALPPAFAEIDALVNNAGLALGTGPAQASSLDQWRQMIDTNVTGLAAITHKVLPKLIARKGSIVNLGSVAAHYPYPGGNVYGGTKAFVHQFTLNLRSDLSGTGVRVTSVEPGLCESEFTLVRTGGDQAAYDKLYKGANALQPKDIAETIFWIATLPPHMNINIIEMMPVSQSFSPFTVHREGV